jgi:predicted HicB family RNase H-like nuclease
MMEYRGYLATVDYDDEAAIFHGEVVNTRAVITFQGRSVDDLRRELAESVEDYLAWCAERGKAPEKPHSGKLLVRATPELHRAVAAAAAQEQQSVNAWITRVLEESGWPVLH